VQFRALPIEGGSNTSERQPLHISAVLFIDGSGEGDPSGIEDLKMLRLGRQIAARRILPVLDVLNTTDVEREAAGISRAIQELQNLSEDDASEKPATGSRIRYG
jgi:hypothetical protein